MTDRELLDDLLNGCVMAKGQGKRSDNTYILEEMIEIIRTRLAQPNKEWEGLTDEEREEIALELPIDAVRITEAKLKEKNT